VGSKVYFRCTDRIMALDTTFRDPVIYPAPNEWVYMACVGQEVLAQDKQQGLLRLQSGQWQTIVPHAFNNETITGILPAVGSDAYLITTLKHGAYLLTGNRLMAVRLPA